MYFVDECIFPLHLDVHPDSFYPVGNNYQGIEETQIFSSSTCLSDGPVFHRTEMVVSLWRTGQVRGCACPSTTSYGATHTYIVIHILTSRLLVLRKYKFYNGSYKI
jgi:hypothetical protein